MSTGGHPEDTPAPGHPQTSREVHSGETQMPVTRAVGAHEGLPERDTETHGSPDR